MLKYRVAIWNWILNFKVPVLISFKSSLTQQRMFRSIQLKLMERQPNSIQNYLTMDTLAFLNYSSLENNGYLYQL